jgi:hypothetical protein
MQSVSVPQSKSKRWGHYLSFVRTVVSRFSRVPIWSKRIFTRAVSSDMPLDCCWGWLAGGAGTGIGVVGRFLKVICA